MELDLAKVCYLDPCAKLYPHFPYVPRVLCTEESRLEPGELGESPTANPSTRQFGLLWRKGCHFAPKKHPSRKKVGHKKHQKLKYCITVPWEDHI